MKLVLSLMMLVFSLSAHGAQDYLPGTYKIDPAHSRADFVVSHLVISEVSGRFNDISGSIILDEKFSKSNVDVSIPVNSIDTAVEKRDTHLKSADFFDAKKFPTMNFKSQTILGTERLFRLKGMLTIKDVTKEVTFMSKFKGSLKDQQGKTRVAVEGTAKINRQDFNIKYNDMIPEGPAVGNEVEITIRIEAVKQ